MSRCDYCGLTYWYAVCPYDGTALSTMWDATCQNRVGQHNLTIPQQYRSLVNYSPIGNVAACPSCRTPYFYSYLTPQQRAEFNRLRQAAACFIATAAMGSHLHPHIQSLRNFRDGILLKSRHKDSFENLLRFYYKFSPPIARTMIKNKYLKGFLRYALVYPVVFAIKIVLPVFNAVLGIERDAKSRRDSSP